MKMRVTLQAVIKALMPRAPVGDTPAPPKQFAPPAIQAGATLTY